MATLKDLKLKVDVAVVKSITDTFRISPEEFKKVAGERYAQALEVLSAVKPTNYTSPPDRLLDNGDVIRGADDDVAQIEDTKFFKAIDNYAASNMRSYRPLLQFERPKLEEPQEILPEVDLGGPRRLKI